MYSVKYKCLIGFFTACAVSDTSGVSVTLKELITAHVRYEWCECYVWKSESSVQGKLALLEKTWLLMACGSWGVCLSEKSVVVYMHWAYVHHPTYYFLARMQFDLLILVSTSCLLHVYKSLVRWFCTAVYSFVTVVVRHGKFVLNLIVRWPQFPGRIASFSKSLVISIFIRGKMLLVWFSLNYKGLQPGMAAQPIGKVRLHHYMCLKGHLSGSLEKPGTTPG